MRNQIGIPPVDRQVDTGAAPSGALGTPSPKLPTTKRTHPGMDPEVAEGARHGEAPYVGGFDRPVTERDTNVGLYVGITIGVIALIIVGMVLMAFF